MDQTPEDARYEPQQETSFSRVQGLVNSLIENSEELTRVLLDTAYETREPLNRDFERYLRLFIIQLKTFQNELQG
jgi:hypothetical protein